MRRYTRYREHMVQVGIAHMLEASAAGGKKVTLAALEEIVRLVKRQLYESELNAAEDELAVGLYTRGYRILYGTSLTDFAGLVPCDETGRYRRCQLLKTPIATTDDLPRGRVDEAVLKALLATKFAWEGKVTFGKEGRRMVELMAALETLSEEERAWKAYKALDPFSPYRILG